MTGQAKLAFAAPVEPVKTLDKATLLTDVEELERLIKKLQTKPVFAIDTETDSLNVLDANLVGIAVSWQEDCSLEIKNNRLIATKEEFVCNSAYIPLGHKEGKNLDLDQSLVLFKPLLEDNKVGKIRHNAKYDIHILKNYDITINNVIYDTMLASYIEEPSERHGLKELAMQKFHVAMTEYNELAGKGK